MSILIVVNQPSNWPFTRRGVRVVSAKAYLTEPEFAELRGARVFNLCRSYRYMSTGYYVSLLAAARGQVPLPGIETLQALRSPSLVRAHSEDLDDLIQRSLARLRSKSFELSIYFGRNLAQRYDRLSRQLFNLFPAPLLRATFVKNEAWRLQSLRPIAASEVPDRHRDFIGEAAQEYFARRTRRRAKRPARFDLAILHDPDEEEPPSDERAIKKFVRAAAECDMRAEVVDRNDYGRLAEFDALFLRETTYVNHHTYRWASRAEAEGLVVIDDPASIVRCTNKIFLAELLERREIPTPRTVIGHPDNLDRIAGELGLPCILKRPDSSFSQGVVKVETAEALRREAKAMLEDSDLFVAQEFLPTDFDWRVTAIDGKVLFVCKYFMAGGHWQILNWSRTRQGRYGKVEAIDPAEAPPRVLKTALRAAKAIGDGLYGVDLKESGRRTYVIEVNDNPSIEAGWEDRHAGDELYLEIMRTFLERIERRVARKGAA